MFARSLLLLAGLAVAHAFAPLNVPFGLKRHGRASACKSLCLSMQATKTSLLTPDLFNKLDKDRNGSIDIVELKEALGQQSSSEISALMARADLNQDGVIDYAEYERLMNMEKYNDEQGGNLYVRNAIKFGLLRPDSILSDNVLVGNKGFDPLNCATSEPVLRSYREAELKHGRLAMLAAAGWPVSELVQPWLSAAFKAPDLLASGEKAPSILNGGLDKVLSLKTYVRYSFA